MGSIPESLGAATYPDRRKLKKQRVDAAHSIFASSWFSSPNQVCFIISRISGVIGRCCQQVPELPNCFMPLSTYSRWGILPILDP